MLKNLCHVTINVCLLQNTSLFLSQRDSSVISQYFSSACLINITENGQDFPNIPLSCASSPTNAALFRRARGSASKTWAVWCSTCRAPGGCWGSWQSPELLVRESLLLCVVSVSPLCGFCLSSVWFLSLLCVVSVSPLCGFCLSSVWFLSLLCVVSVSPLCGFCLSSVWFLSLLCVVSVSPLCGFCLSSVWFLSLLCVVSVSPLCGFCLSSVWFLSLLCVFSVSPLCGFCLSSVWFLSLLCVVCGFGLVVYNLHAINPLLPNSNNN